MNRLLTGIGACLGAVMAAPLVFFAASGSATAAVPLPSPAAIVGTGIFDNLLSAQTVGGKWTAARVRTVFFASSLEEVVVR